MHVAAALGLAAQDVLVEEGEGVADAVVGVDGAAVGVYGEVGEGGVLVVRRWC